MTRQAFVAIVGGVVLSAACQQPPAPTAPAGVDGLGATAALPAQAGASGANGGGRYLLIGSIDTQFAFSAVRTNGRTAGKFHQTLEFQGQHVEFHGEVTCVSVDGANGRAWIGGVITQNNSAHPSFQTERHQPGRDIWFRVLDTGNPGGAGDRTTFVGFEGDAGFATSADYCAGQPWPDNNARTWPVTSGNISVRP